MEGHAPQDAVERFQVKEAVISHFAWLNTRLALESTMMAWVRTATTLIGFGFTIVQFFERLNNMEGVAPAAQAVRGALRGARLDRSRRGRTRGVGHAISRDDPLPVARRVREDRRHGERSGKHAHLRDHDRYRGDRRVGLPGRFSPRGLTS